MTYEQENQALASAYDYMTAHDMYVDMWTEHTPIEQGLIVKANIDWGDWKHDHLRYEWLMEEWARENGYLVVSNSEAVTEEDGSDCYSALHHTGLFKKAE